HARAFQACSLSQLARFVPGECSRNGAWSIEMHYWRARQHPTAGKRQNMSNVRAHQIVHQHHLPGGLPHSPQQINGFLNFQMVQKQRTGDDVEVTGQWIVDSIQCEEMNRSAGTCGALTGFFQRFGAEVRRRQFNRQLCPAKALPEPDGNVAAAGGDIQNSQRPAGVGLRQPVQWPPENTRAAAEPVDAGQATQGRRMLVRVKPRLIHQFRLAIALSQIPKSQSYKSYLSYTS